MQIYVNGKLHQLEAQCSISALLESLEYVDRRVAVELNEEIVPKSEHPSRSLKEGDRIEIVHAIGGG